MTFLSFIIGLLIIFLTSFGQMLLKMGANSSRRLILNRYVMFGYSCFIVVAILSAILMRTVDFKYFSILTGFNYMTTTMLSALILKEKVSPKKYLGCFLVAIGGALFPL